MLNKQHITEEHMTTLIPVTSVEVYHSAFGEGFRRVAEIANYKTGDVNSELDTAYRMTNTINNPWFQITEQYEGGVFVLGDSVDIKEGVRSTSVGDFMAVHFEDGSVEWYSVDTIGFSKMNDCDTVEMVSYVQVNSETKRKYESVIFADLRELEN